MTKQVSYIADDYFLDNGEKLDGYIFNTMEECLKFERYVSQTNWQQKLSEEINKIWKKSRLIIDNNISEKVNEFIEKYDLVVEPVNNKNRNLNNKDLWIGFYNSEMVKKFFSKSDYNQDFLKLPQKMKNKYYICINIDIIICSKEIENIFLVIKEYVEKNVGFNNLYKMGNSK